MATGSSVKVQGMDKEDKTIFGMDLKLIYREYRTVNAILAENMEIYCPHWFLYSI